MFAALLTAAAPVLWCRASLASALLTPASGAADAATAGTRIADPHTPTAAVFSNPAGLTRFTRPTASGAFGVGYGWARVTASPPADYRETHDFFVGVPALGVSIPFLERWSFGFGAFGTTGSTFDFEADPSLGVSDMFSETIVASVPVGLAYRVTDRFSVGAQVEPLFGQLRTHFTVGGLEFRYKLNGAGVQGAIGGTYRLNDRWSLGLSVRTPGMIWMDGSMPIEGVGRQDVDLELEMPTQVFLGATWRCTDRLTLSGSARFTDSSTFGESEIEYELTPQANIGFIPDSKDEWRVALGGEYAPTGEWRLRAGSMYASRIVGSRGVSPLVFDTEDIRVMAGAGRAFGNLLVDVVLGYVVPMDRTIAAQDALLIPGKYEMRGGVFMLELTYRFPESES